MDAAPSFDPSQPFDAVPAPGSAPAFDASQPFDPVSASSPAPTTSQWLGFKKGVMHALDNAAQGAKWAANNGAVPFISAPLPGQPGAGDLIDSLGQHLGLPSTENAVQSHQDYLSDQAKHGVVPGKIGEFGGDVAATIPLMATGMGPIASGASTGALLTDKKDPAGILTDIALGGALGKVGDLAVSGLTKAAAPVVKSISKRVGNWIAPGSQSAVAPETGQAADYVQKLIANSGKSLSDVADYGTHLAPKPVTSAEAIGPQGTSAVSALARRQGATGPAAAAQLGERASGMRGRILDDYASAAGVIPEAAQGDIESLVQAGRAQAKPLFDQAFATPGPIWNSALATLAKRPVIKKAISDASTDLLNADVHPGVLGLPSGLDEGQLLPTAQAWDLIKKNLGSAVERDTFGKVVPDTVSRGNFNINASNRALTNALRSAIPGYGAALDASGDYLTLQTAFQNGQKYILSPTFTAKQMADQVAKMSPAELNAFKGGIANQLFNKAQNAQLHPSVFSRPILRQKLQAVLGSDASDTFLNNMQAESDMARSGARMAPGTNSITSEVMNAGDEQNQNGMFAVFDALRGASHAVSGNHLSAAASIASALKRIGVIGKTTGMPVPVRDEAGRMLLMRPADLVSHLQGLYADGNPAAVQRVAQFLTHLKAPAQVALPAAAMEARSDGP